MSQPKGLHRTVAEKLGYADILSCHIASTFLSPEGGDETWFVTPTADGSRWAAWDTSDFSRPEVAYFASHNDAARHFIAGAVENYRIFHELGDGDEVTVDTREDDQGRIVGFRLSLDVDGRSHGADEKFGIWG